MASFNALSRVEQDSFLNELLVSNLVLIMLILEAPDLRGHFRVPGPSDQGERVASEGAYRLP